MILIGITEKVSSFNDGLAALQETNDGMQSRLDEVVAEKNALYADLENAMQQNEVIGQKEVDLTRQVSDLEVIRQKLISQMQSIQVRQSTSLYLIRLYAVKVQRSLAPLSRFRGSHITTAHEQQCCRFQSYAKTVPSPMKLTSEIDKA